MLDEALKILKTSNLFITGGAGVGKSYLVKEIISHYKCMGKNVAALGSTGISAVGVGGVTLHSFFRLGICNNLEELKILDRRQKNRLKETKNIIKSCDIIIIDEISMVSAMVMELIYFRLISSEFSGKIIVVGDFYQLAPIKKDKQSDQNSLFNFYHAFASHAWSAFGFRYLELVGSKRSNDEQFCELLSRLRMGVSNDEDIKYLLNLRQNVHQLDTQATVLFGRNYEADRLNQKSLDTIDAKLMINEGRYEIYDEMINEASFNKWLMNLNVSALFSFKIGARVIFTFNKRGEFYNGEQGVIKDFKTSGADVVQISVQKSSGDTVDIGLHSYDYVEMRVSDGEVKEQILASFYQFPLRLSYAITIHKSQGMGIENLSCDLNHIFANGQLYVALSRATNPKKLSIIYERSKPFHQFIKESTKIDDEVKKFYDESEFIKFI